MKKRLFSAVLVLLFSVACSVMAVAATSGGDEADEVVRAGGFLFHFNRDRTALSLWFCNRADRNMTLPDKVYYDGTTKEASLKPFGKAKAYTVEELEERTFRGNPDIQSVTIPASYRTVGGTAFMNCPNLKTFVGLGKDVMYGNDLFSGCVSLENVTIDARAIGSHIFEGCERLIKPHITGTLDHIPDAAFQKSGIRSIDFIPQSVTAIWAGAFTESQLEGDLVLPLRFAVIVNGAFSLTNIRSVTVPEGFRELRDGVFAGCRSLSKVSLPGTLKYLGGMEFSATAIKQIDIPNSVIDLGPSAFFNCLQLDSVRLSNQLDKLEPSIFQGTALKHIYLPASIKSIGKGCFMFCRQLTDVYCFSTTPPEAHEYGFNDFDKPTIHVPKGTLAAYKSAPTWKKFKKFKEMPAAATDISTTQFATSNIYRQDNEVHVNDVPDGTLVQVYTLDGQLISEVTVHNTGAVLPLNTENPVIVRAGRQTVKLR